MVYRGDIDKDLVLAIEMYCSQLEQRMLARARKGEAVYKGKWKELTTDQVASELAEEEDDVHVYRAMIESKQRRERLASFSCTCGRIAYCSHCADKMVTH